MNYIRKKTPEDFHIYVIFFAFTEIRTDLPTEFRPNPNRDVNHYVAYATDHLLGTKVNSMASRVKGLVVCL